MLLPYLIFFITSILITPSLSQQQCHPDDKAALTALKNGFVSSNNFPTWEPPFDCCDWYGVECNETTGFVTGLNLINGNLDSPRGSIPPAIAGLKHLQTLRLHKLPGLTGEIPPAIGELTSVRYLEISWTNVSGPIPDFLIKLKRLTILNLSFNNLSGSIPPSLAKLQSISGIDLSRNRLTGPIPESFGHLAPAFYLVLSHNMLSGDIPSSLMNVNFGTIDLSRNNLSGDASVLFGKGKEASIIDISRNRFEFDFSKARFMDSLDGLDISHNMIYGSIDQQITDAVFLQALNVSYNRLCGKIPTGWKLQYRPEGWDETSFFHNKCLCGAPLDNPCK